MRKRQFSIAERNRKQKVKVRSERQYSIFSQLCEVDNKVLFMFKAPEEGMLTKWRITPVTMVGANAKITVDIDALLEIHSIIPTEDLILPDQYMADAWEMKISVQTGNISKVWITFVWQSGPK